MRFSLFELVAALIVGAVALFVLKLIGLILKLALIAALLVTLAAWLVFSAIRRTFAKRP